MSSRDTVKIMLVKRYMTVTELSKRMSLITGKKYTRQSLSKKISRSALNYDEMEQIAKILDFKIEVIDLMNNERL